MPSKRNRVYPVVKDEYDSRDMRLAPRGAGLSIPSNYSLGKWLGPIKDQGDLGACTAFSWSSVREFLYRKYFQWEKDKQVMYDAFRLSPLFLYYQERVMENDINMDNGAQSRTGAVVLNKIGCCTEAEDPYRPSKFAEAPDGNEVAEALLYRAGAYHRIMDLQTLKTVIATDYVASIGIQVYAGFESDAAASTGNIPMPANNEEFLGGHEITPFAYDDNHVNADGSKGAVQFLNSWGINWGAKIEAKPEPQGSGWLPYSYFNGDLVTDLWMIHLSKPWVPGKPVKPEPATT